MIGDSVSGPPNTNLVRYGMVFSSNEFNELSNAHFSPQKLYHSIILSIAILLYGSCPSAIIGSVAKGSVDSVYGVIIGRAMAHIFHEHFVAVPPFANWNQCRVSLSNQLFASEHVLPAAISSASMLAVGRLGLSDLRTDALLTALAFPVSKAVASNCGFSSAVASAFPSGVSASSVDGASFKDGPRPESLTGNVFDVWVKDGTTIFGFDHIQRMVEVSSGPPASTGDRRALFMPLA